MLNEEIKWAEIESQIDDIEGLLRDMPIVASVEELDAHEAMLKLGHSSVLAKKLAADKRAYFGSENTRKRLIQLEHDIRNGGSNVMMGIGNCFSVLRECIATRRLSTEFILDWGYLNQLLGRYAELMERADVEQPQFNKYVNSGLSQTSILQRYWHAHWVTANTSNLVTREVAQDGLAKVCALVSLGRLRPPPNYTSDWFAKMLKETPTDGFLAENYLATPYTRATPANIKFMINNSGIPVAVLPPLSRSEFKKT